MIDEEILRDKLTEAAAAQDDLLPRALSDDLAAGHRRLRRYQVFAGGGTVLAAALVGGLTLGLTSWLGPDTGSAPGFGPAATTTTAPAPSQPPPSLRSPLASLVPSASGDPASRVGGQNKAFDAMMRTVLAQHVDPARRHLDYTSGGFELDLQPGVRRGGGRIGWRMPDQPGAEGYISLGVSSSAKATSARCGSELIQPAVTCHPVRLANGRTAQLGRRGDAVEVTYVQPDGEYVSVTVNPLFGNNTEIPVHDLGITDGQLLALVQDPRLTLPKPAGGDQDKEDRMKNHQPPVAVIRAAVVRQVTGARLTFDRTEDVPEQLGVRYIWQQGAVKRYLEVGLDSSVTVSSCQEQTGVTCRQETLPDGRKVWYGEDRATGRYGAVYIQPDGDSAWVRVNPEREAAAGPADLSKQQLIDLVTDPTLDR